MNRNLDPKSNTGSKLLTALAVTGVLAPISAVVGGLPNVVAGIATTPRVNHNETVVR
jgi:hypothetical protein